MKEVRDGKNIIVIDQWSEEFLNENCLKNKALVVEAGKIVEETEILIKEEYKRFDHLPGINIPLYKYFTKAKEEIFEDIETISADDPAVIGLILKDKSGNVLKDVLKTYYQYMKQFLG